MSRQNTKKINEEEFVKEKKSFKTKSQKLTLVHPLVQSVQDELATEVHACQCDDYEVCDYEVTD